MRNVNDRQKDELLTKIKEFVEWHIEDCELNVPMSEYTKGWYDSMIALQELLK